MNLFKKIPCENYKSINKQIINWINTTDLVYSRNFWNPIDVKHFLKQCPLFLSWTRENNIPVKTIAVTVGSTVDCCGPHTDAEPARFKLSWPILNTGNTYNRWYNIIDATKFKINNLDGICYEYSNLKEICRTEVVDPMIIDAGTVHDVLVEHDNFPRLGLQCQLIKEPAWI